MDLLQSLAARTVIQRLYYPAGAYAELCVPEHFDRRPDIRGVSGRGTSAGSAIGCSARLDQGARRRSAFGVTGESTPNIRPWQHVNHHTWVALPLIERFLRTLVTSCALADVEPGTKSSRCRISRSTVFRLRLRRVLGTKQAFLNLQEFPGYTTVRPSLVRHASTVVPYECHVFTEAKGRRLVVRRKEIAFFSHCWDLPPDQVCAYVCSVWTFCRGLIIPDSGSAISF